MMKPIDAEFVEIKTEEVIGVDAETFPSLPVLIARVKGPYGIRIVEPGERIYWKLQDGVKWFLENVDGKPLTFEVVSMTAYEDRKEVAV